MNLIRKYKLDKDQLTREYEQAREENWRQFQMQMADLQRQRDQRLAQLAAELQARLAAIEAERRREREDEDLRNQQRLDDEKKAFDDRVAAEKVRYDQYKIDEGLRYEQDRTDRLTRYQQALDDLNAHLTDEYNAIAKALADQITVTDTSTQALLKVLQDALGTGGGAEGIFDQYLQIIGNATAQTQTFFSYLPAVMQMIGLIGSIPNLNYPTIPPGGGGGGRGGYVAEAEGGSIIADRPTKVIFGEAGLEMAQFTPLDKPVTPNLITNLGSPLSVDDRGGNMKIEILLDKYLEGRIIDTPLDNVADVIIRRLR